MAKVIKNNLGYLGVDFQFKLVKTFMEEPNFFRELYPIVDQNMFTDPTLKTFVGVLKEYFNNNDLIPSYTMMGIKLHEKAYSEIELETFDATLQKIKETSTEGIDEIRSLAERFFKQQNLIKVANQILKIAGDGDIDKYDDCARLLEEVSNVGNDEDLGESPLDDVDEVLSDDYRITIPTGIKRIDEALEGGIGIGELGVIIGPSSFGKVQPNDSLIVTPFGYKKMGDISVGDTIIGRNGAPIKVIGVFPHKNWQFYKVTFSDGSVVECGSEHLWTVNDNSLNTEENWNTLSLEKIMEYGLLFDNDKFRFNIPLCNEVSFDPKVITYSYFNAYAYGHMMGCNAFNGISFLYNSPLTKESAYIIDSFKYDSIGSRRLLLNGLMDANGKCDDNGVCSYSTISKPLAEDIKEVVSSLGGIATIVNNDNKNFTIYINLGKDTPLFYANTKNEEKRLKYYKDFKRFIVKIEKGRICDGQCIKVDADDELYLTNDYVVTHNTSLTTAMASYAATYKCEANDNKGFKVLQIVFEDRVKQIKRKHIGRLAQIEAKDLSKPDYIEIVKHTLEACPERELIKNNIRIKKYPSGEKTPNDIKRFIKRLRNSGFVPQLVIIDYFECLAADKDQNGNSDSEWSKEGKTMRKIETMAEEFGVAIWVPTQGTKDSIGAELVTMDKSGGSIKKIQIGHIVMSIARSMENIKENKANIAILKNRAGQAGLIINGVNFNNGTCTISTDDVIEFDDALAYHEHENKVKADNILATSKEIFNEINKNNSN